METALSETVRLERPIMDEPLNESALLSRLLVRCSQLGARIFRNNVGKLRDAHGRLVTYGLCVGSSAEFGSPT